MQRQTLTGVTIGHMREVEHARLTDLGTPMSDNAPAEYKRTSVVRRGVAAYGLFYSSFASAWGVVALAFVGFVVWALTTSPSTNVLYAGLFCGAALLQVIQAYGLLRLYKWARVLALVQATVMSAVLGCLLVLIATWPTQPPLKDIWPTLAIMVAEWFVATGLLVVIIRSWVIDRELRRSLNSIAKPEL